MRRVCAAMLVGWSLGSAALAQTDPPRPDPYEFRQDAKRIALVIGNASYVNQQQLPGALVDGDNVATMLRGLGFEVTAVNDVANWTEFYYVTFKQFLDGIEPGSIVLFYFSGHGLSYGGEGYLAPLKFPLPIPYAKLTSTLLSVTAVRDMITGRDPSVAIMVLDACRNLPNIIDETGRAAKAGQEKGLAPTTEDLTNTVIWFASGQNKPALADPAGRASFYTGAFLAHFGDRDSQIDKVRKDIRIDVMQATNGGQVPWSNESSSAELWLNPTQTTTNVLLSLWRAARQAGTREQVDHFLMVYGATSYAAAARKWLHDHPQLATAAASSVSPIAPEALWDSKPTRSVLQQSDASYAALRMDGLFGLPRITSAFGNNHHSLASYTRPSDAKAAVIADQGQLVTRDAVTAQRTPTDATAAFVLPRGSRVDVDRSALGPGGTDWVIVRRPGLDGSAAIQLPPTTRLGAVGIGDPARELLVPPPSSGPGAAADTGPVAAALSEIGQGGKQVSWVSIATPPASSGRLRTLLQLRANFVAQFLVDHGVAAQAITTAEGLAPPGDDIRLRFFSREK